MPTFVSLLNWTDQGIRTFPDTVNRANAVSAAAEGFGGRILNIYWTIGQYDLVTISEFPDDETATAFLLTLGALGNVRTESLRAYNAEEMSRIISKTG
jgi:uncharacterized protein with GYD domain